MRTVNYSKDIFTVISFYNDDLPQFETFRTLENAKVFRDEQIKNDTVHHVQLLELLSASGKA
jgi:hypothetical protein